MTQEAPETRAFLPFQRGSMQLHLNFTLQRDVYIHDHSRHASYSHSCNTTNTGFYQLPMTYPYPSDESSPTVTVPDPEPEGLLFASPGRAYCTRAKRSSANDKPSVARRTRMMPCKWVSWFASSQVRMKAALLATAIGALVYALMVFKSKNI